MSDPKDEALKGAPHGGGSWSSERREQWLTKQAEQADETYRTGSMPKLLPGLGET